MILLDMLLFTYYIIIKKIKDSSKSNKVKLASDLFDSCYTLGNFVIIKRKAVIPANKCKHACVF